MTPCEHAAKSWDPVQGPREAAPGQSGDKASAGKMPA